MESKGFYWINNLRENYHFSTDESFKSVETTTGWGTQVFSMIFTNRLTFTDFSIENEKEKFEANLKMSEEENKKNAMLKDFE